VITNQIDRDKKMALYFVLIAFNNSPSWRSRSRVKWGKELGKTIS